MSEVSSPSSFEHLLSASIGSLAALGTRGQMHQNPSMASAHLTSPLLDGWGFVHQFFSRRGGVSPPPFESMNFSVGVGDAPAHVAENFRRAGLELGVAPDKIYFLDQVHGAAVWEVDSTQERDSVSNTPGDALVTIDPGCAVGVRTADCVPILFACERTGWVAVAHAGWRGCAANIAARTVERLREVGATRIGAAIGPHISAAAFEVSDEVAEQLVAASPAPNIVDRSGSKPHVDLRKLVRAQLVGAGLPHELIDDVFGCTKAEPELFFSYRRDGKRSGRHISAIVPRDTGAPTSER